MIPIAILWQIGCAHSPSHKETLQLALTSDQQGTSSEPKVYSPYRFLTKEQEPLLAPGDLIGLNYSVDNKMNGRFRLSFDGSLLLPYNVKIKAAGLRLGDLTKLVHAKYVDFYKNANEIQVTLIERKRWLQIAGDISVTGLKLVDPGSDLIEILSLKSSNGAVSNSTEERKKLKYLKIKWNDSTGIIDLKKFFQNELSWEGRKWHGGEILSFQSNLTSDDDDMPMVRVLGEVNEPGSYEYTENADYFSYILKAGGTTSLADIDRVYIIRGPAFKRETLQVGIGDLNNLGSPSPHDTILLMRDRTSLTERRISMAASIASIISTLLIFKVIF